MSFTCPLLHPREPCIRPDASTKQKRRCALYASILIVRSVLAFSRYVCNAKEKKKKKSCYAGDTLSKTVKEDNPLVHLGTAMHSKAALGHLGLVVPHHLLEAHADRPAGLPVEGRLGACRVGAALLRVVLGEALMDDVDAAGSGDAVSALYVLDDIADELSKLEDGELVAVAEVDGARLGRVHERDEAVHEVVDVLERARLRAVAVDGQVLPAQRLHDEVGDDAPVVRVHCDRRT